MCPYELKLLCHSKTDARFMQDGRKAVWTIPYVSVAFFPSLKHNFIAYRSSKVSDCICEIHQLWQSGFSRVYSNSFCSCSFEAEIIKIGWSSHKMYSNNILNFQEFTIILNAHIKKVWKLIICTSYVIIFKSYLLLLGATIMQHPVRINLIPNWSLMEVMLILKLHCFFLHFSQIVCFDFIPLIFLLSKVGDRSWGRP